MTGLRKVKPDWYMFSLNDGEFVWFGADPLALYLRAIEWHAVNVRNAKARAYLLEKKVARLLS